MYNELLVKKMNEGKIYLAAGCFWGSEKAFSLLKGVLSTRVGYVNGNTENPSYEEVCQDNTGFKEAVEIIYDRDTLSLETILKAFFLCIHPDQKNRQGNDIGSQYQTGVYYIDKEDYPVLEKIFEEERKRHGAFYVELEEMENFYEAEEYHQKYLDKNPNGYCHIGSYEFEKILELNGKDVRK